MKYTLDRKLNIGREIYSKSITANEADITYAINNYTAREYMRFYRDKNNLPPLNQNKTIEIFKKQEKNVNITLFREYHDKYPTHWYRWLNAKIKLELGIVYSDNYAQRCCKYAGIRSISKRYKYTKPGQKNKVYANLLLADLPINRPFQVVVLDMTAFWCKQIYYELTLYMDLFNNEIVAYDISAKKGDQMTYINGLNDLIEKKNTQALN